MPGAKVTALGWIGIARDRFIKKLAGIPRLASAHTNHLNNHDDIWWFIDSLPCQVAYLIGRGRIPEGARNRARAPVPFSSAFGVTNGGLADLPRLPSDQSDRLKQ